MSEWRAAESKSKKHSFVSARENEKLQDITLDVRLSGGLTGSNKLTASSLHLHQKQGSEKESSKVNLMWELLQIWSFSNLLSFSLHCFVKMINAKRNFMLHLCIK